MTTFYTPIHMPDNRITGALSKRALLPFIVVVGAMIRFAHIPFIDLSQPYMLGGLFAQFAEEIAANSWRLPVVIPYYTSGGIPFAYPPLAFYVEAVGIWVLGIPEMLVVNLLPPMFAVASMGTFWLFVRAMRLPETSQVAALAIFAVFPSAYQNQVPAMGLAEALGTVAIPLFAATLFLNSGTYRDGLRMALAWSFCLTASPGSALCSVALALIFLIDAIAVQRNRKQLVGLIVSAALTAVISSVYWWPVLSQHGMTVFTNTLFSQFPGSVYTPLVNVLRFGASGASFPVLVDGLAFIGALYLISTGRWITAIWLVLCLAIPREGKWLVSVPSAIAASVAITQVVIHSVTSRRFALLLLLALVGYSILNAVWHLRNEIGDKEFVLPPDASAVFHDMRRTTDHNTRFIVDPTNQALLEWSPRLLAREVLNTPFGAEWEPRELTLIAEFNRELGDCATDTCRLRLSRRFANTGPLKFIYADGGSIYALDVP